MKNLLLTLLLFGCVVANAQTPFYWFMPGDAETLKTYIDWKKNFRDSIIKNNITATTTYAKYYDKKERLKSSVVKLEQKYDNRGDLVSETYYNRRGQPTETNFYTYNDNGLQTGFKKYDAKGKYVRSWELTLNDAGLVTKRSFYWKDETRLAWYETIEYNAEGKPVKTTNYDKKGKPYYVVENDYENGSKKETRQYNKKGKLKKVIKYDCQPTGTLSNGKKADTTTYCTNSSYDADSNKITTTEIIKQNGKIWRNIYKTDKKGHLLEWKAIDHKGKERYNESYTYNEAGKAVGFVHKTPRTRFNYRLIYEYNADGQKTITKRYNSKDRLQYEVHELVR